MKEQFIQLFRKAKIAVPHFGSVSWREFSRFSAPHEHACEYLDTCVPDTDAWINGVRLFSAKSIENESLNLLPGCLVVPFGFIPVAGLSSGDPFILDMQSSNVYLLGADKYSSDGLISPGWNSTFTDFLPDAPVSRESIIQTANEAIGRITEFAGFVDGCTLETA